MPIFPFPGSTRFRGLVSAYSFSAASCSSTFTWRTRALAGSMAYFAGSER